MSRIAAWLPATVGVAVLIALHAGAQGNPTFETVVRVGAGVNGDQIVVQNPAGVRRTIVLDRTTRIDRTTPSVTGGSLQMQDIMAGDRIIVSGTPQGGRFNAQRIQILEPLGAGTAPPGAANPASPPAAGAPNTANPVGPPASPPGAARPTVPANPAQPPGAAPANPAQPPGSGAGANPAAPPAPAPAPGGGAAPRM
jgi:hypothetical protein